MKPNESPTLLFVHIPKTAGTAVRTLFERRFDSERLALLYDRPPGMPLTQFLEVPQFARDRFQAVVGHFAFGLHHFITKPVRYITFLRDPVERVVSLYYHNVHRASRHHDQIHAEGIDLGRFVRDRVSYQVENSMTQFLAGIEHVAGGDRRVFRNGCPDRMLDLAKQNLVDWFDLVAITERSEESFALLARHLGLAERPAPRANENRERPDVQAIDGKVLDEIRRINELDVELYRFAQGLFQRHLASAHNACFPALQPATQ